jgi:hypothetical protein
MTLRKTLAGLTAIALAAGLAVAQPAMAQSKPTATKKSVNISQNKKSTASETMLHHRRIALKAMQIKAEKLREQLNSIEPPSSEPIYFNRQQFDSQISFIPGKTGYDDLKRQVETAYGHQTARASAIYDRNESCRQALFNQKNAILHAFESELKSGDPVIRSEAEKHVTTAAKELTLIAEQYTEILNRATAKREALDSLDSNEREQEEQEEELRRRHEEQMQEEEYQQQQLYEEQQMHLLYY